MNAYAEDAGVNRPDNPNHFETPQDFYYRLDAEFGFTLDAFASETNAKCGAYFTAGHSAFDHPWTREACLGVLNARCPMPRRLRQPSLCVQRARQGRKADGRAQRVPGFGRRGPYPAVDRDAVVGRARHAPRGRSAVRAGPAVLRVPRQAHDHSKREGPGRHRQQSGRRGPQFGSMDAHLPEAAE